MGTYSDESSTIVDMRLKTRSSIYRRSIFQILAGVCSLTLLQTGAEAKSQEPVAHPDIRTIRFPECSIGRLQLVRQKDFVAVGKAELPTPPPRGEVKITVPPGDCLELEISGAAVRHPDCLRQMSGRGIDSVAIRNISSFDDGKSDANAVTRNLLQFGDLQHVIFERVDATDEALLMMKKFPRMRNIQFWGAEEINGSSFAAFAALPQLYMLDFRGCPGIKNENLKYLPGLRSLRELELCSTKINSTGIKYISQCTNLKMLDLRNSGINDEELLQLLSLKRLEELDLTKCPVTARGLAALAPLKLKLLAIPSFVSSSAQTLAGLKSALPGTEIRLVRESNAAVEADAMKWFSK